MRLETLIYHPFEAQRTLNILEFPSGNRIVVFPARHSGEVPLAQGDEIQNPGNLKGKNLFRMLRGPTLSGTTNDQ